MDLAAVPVDEEFGEIPFDAVALGIVRIVFGNDLLDELAAFFIRFVALERRGFCKVLVQRCCLVTADVDFRKEREGDAVVEAAELFDVLVIFRILFQELVAREAEDDQAFILIFLI